MATKYLSGCCDKPAVNVEGEYGTCCYCGKECEAYDPEMLKPISVQDVINSVNKKHGEPETEIKKT